MPGPRPPSFPSSWLPRARCRSYPTPDDFHPEPGDWTRPGPWAALAVCQPCPVRAPCLAAGAGWSGIWGGLPEPERAVVYLQGWRPGRPIPHVRVTTSWVTLREAALTLNIPRRRVRAWAERAQVDSRWAPMHHGQTTRLVDLEQCRRHLEAA